MTLALLLGATIALDAKNPMINPAFEQGLDGWKREGQVAVDAQAPISGKASLLLGPGEGAVRQRYDVPGLRILWFGGKSQAAGGALGQFRVECFDRHGHLLMNVTTPTDDKKGAGVYLKTQAHTAYVTLGVEKRGPGELRVDDLSLQDDGPPTKHDPQVDLDLLMQPVWQGETVVDESVLLLSEDGAPASGRMLFQPKEVVRVRDATHAADYVEGKDFRVEGDRIVAAAGSKISTLDASAFPKGDYPWFDLAPHQVFVTYRHTDSRSFPVPTYEGGQLPLTMGRLKGRKPLTIVAFGDSITLGVGTSAFRDKPPYQPPWPSLLTHWLERRYDDRHIRLYNVALGGMTAAWGAENAKDAVAALDPDLVLIAFGMNDFWSTTPTEYARSIKATMATIRAHRPQTEFILIAPMRFDPAYTADSTYCGNLEGYAAALKSLRSEGVRTFDMTALSASLYKVKGQKSVAADPMHPNDFLARIYAQGLAALLDDKAGHS